MPGIATAPAPRPEFLPLADAADYAQVSVRTIRRWIAIGSLTAHRVGPRLLRIERADLDSMIAVVPTARGKA